MKIWIDISNTPQVHFFKNVIRRLIDDGHEVIVSSRHFGQMETLLMENHIEYTIVGEHGGASKELKLINSSKRILGLTELVAGERPDVALYKHSVEAPRVAYGMGIPSLCVLDNENAIHQNRLMLPLSSRIIAPRAIGKDLITRFGVNESQIRHFEGFCELAHINEFVPSDSVLEELSLSEDAPIAVLRPEPVMANYYNGNGRDSIVTGILDSFEGFQCVVFPRTDLQRELFSRQGAIMPSHSVDSLSLMHHASIVMSAGGSMNREAIALCRPAISTYPEKLLAVTEYMVKEGIKGHSCNPLEIRAMAEEMVNNPSLEHSIRKKLDRMEDPIDVISGELDLLVQ